jgi:hypothetical protein
VGAAAATLRELRTQAALAAAAQRAAAPPEAASLADAARDAEARRRRLAAMFAELAPGAETPLPRSY